MGTPFENAGYTKDTKFKVISEYRDFVVGDIVVLEEDDNSTNPHFTTLDGKKNGYMNLPCRADAEIEVYIEVGTVSTSTFKYPCAVELEGLTLEQAINLEKAFVKLGAKVEDSFAGEDGFCPEDWNYYGVDNVNSINCWDFLAEFSLRWEPVTFYTYDEVMKMIGVERQEAVTPTYSGATDSEGWIVNTGTEPQYLLDGGKIDVKFKDGDVTTEITEDDRAGNGEGAYAICWKLNPEYEETMIVAWKPSAHSDVRPVASSVDDTVTLGGKEYTGSQEGETLPKASTGASVDISINVTIDGNSWGITRDEAYKLYQDLKHIFEVKIV